MPAILLKGINKDGSNLGDQVLSFVAGLGAQTLQTYQKEMLDNQNSQPNSLTPAASPASGKQGFWANMTGTQKMGLGIAAALLAYLIVKRL